MKEKLKKMITIINLMVREKQFIIKEEVIWVLGKMVNIMEKVGIFGRVHKDNMKVRMKMDRNMGWEYRALETA